MERGFGVESIPGPDSLSGITVAGGGKGVEGRGRVKGLIMWGI